MYRGVGGGVVTRSLKADRLVLWGKEPGIINQVVGFPGSVSEGALLIYPNNPSYIQTLTPIGATNDEPFQTSVLLRSLSVLVVYTFRFLPLPPPTPLSLSLSLVHSGLLW